MLNFFQNYYLTLKVIHVLSIISWMAGLLYLPRLFVYHAGVSAVSQTAQLFQTMERRLYYGIMVPAMIFSLASGGILASVLDVWSSGWMHLKLSCIIVLVGFHHMLNHWRRSLATGDCQRSANFFRLINEIPTILLIIIVISVVVKPF